MQPIPLLYFSHHLPQWWWLLLPQACPPSPRHQAQPAGSPPSPGTLLPAPPLLLPPLDRPDQPGRRGQWGPDIANLIWDESDHTVSHTKFYCPTCPCVCPQKFLQVNGREGEGGERRKIHTKEKATQVWPGLWWQSPLRTQMREAEWPGLATSPEGPRSAGCRCCPSLGSPRPQRWAPCPGTSQASRPSAPSYNGAGHPAPRKCNARSDLSTKKAVKVFKEQLPFSKGLTPLTFFLVFQSKT